LLSRTLRIAAYTAVFISGLVLAFRAVHGPFRIGSLPVTSPLNAEGIFAVSATILLIARRGFSSHQPKPSKQTVLWLPVILALTMGALWPALGFPLVFDDYTLVQEANSISPATAAYAFTHSGGDGFFRPVGYLSLGMDALWSGRNPSRWHLGGLLLHMANIVLVWFLATRLADRVAANWAAAIFALHGTVLLTPMYLAARFDVLSVFFVLAGLLLFSEYLRKGRRSLLIGCFVSMILGMLTKETAFAFPLLALLLLSRDRKGAVVAGLFTAATLVFAYRFLLLGGLGGYRDPVTGVPQVLRASLLGYLKGFGLRIWSASYFPVNWSHEPNAWLSGLLIVYMATVVCICARTAATRPKLVGALVFIVIALLPLAHLLLVDATLLGAGRFYLALAGFAFLLGYAVRQISGHAQLAAGLILVLFQFAALRHNLTIWSTTANLAAQTCAAAARMSADDAVPVLELPREIDGVPFLGSANGFGACIEFYRDPQRPVRTSVAALRWDDRTRQLVPVR
jgi:hypothetical protein